jgi:hypothetical protein
MSKDRFKKYFRMTHEVTTIFDDLDKYREFCVEYGYPFDERHLYNEKTPWGEYARVQRGKYPRNNWYAKKERQP